MSLLNIPNNESARDQKRCQLGTLYRLLLPFPDLNRSQHHIGCSRSVILSAGMSLRNIPSNNSAPHTKLCPQGTLCRLMPPFLYLNRSLRHTGCSRSENLSARISLRNIPSNNSVLDQKLCLQGTLYRPLPPFPY